MATTMENIRDMVDVNTVVGEPIVCADGSTVIPVSRVSFGFVAGGGDYGKPHLDKTPFGGGTGAGVSVVPIGFLCLRGETIRMLPAQFSDSVDRALELLPQVMAEVKKWMGKGR